MVIIRKKFTTNLYHSIITFYIKIILNNITFCLFKEGCLQPDPSLRMSVFETLQLVESIRETYKINLESIDVNKLKSEGKPIEPLGVQAPNVPQQQQQPPVTARYIFY